MIKHKQTALFTMQAVRTGKKVPMYVPQPGNLSRYLGQGNRLVGNN